MRRCIFCMKFKDEQEFNKEHIILDSLGGSGIDNILDCVCIECNSKLGTKVDSMFVNDVITEGIRFQLKIKGRNGVPDPFKQMPINYADTPIIGKLKTDKEGNIISFRADCQEIKLSDGKTLIIAPRKNFVGYVDSCLKKRGIFLSKEEILENRLKVKNPKIPTIKYIEPTEEYEDLYLYRATPLLLKMAYEFSVLKLGDGYLEDPVADNIRKCINQLLVDNTEIKFPTSMEFEYRNSLERKTTIGFEMEDSLLYVNICILGTIRGKILVSEESNKYKFDIFDSIVC